MSEGFTSERQSSPKEIALLSNLAKPRIAFAIELKKFEKHGFRRGAWHRYSPRRSFNEAEFIQDYPESEFAIARRNYLAARDLYLDCVKVERGESAARMAHMHEASELTVETKRFALTRFAGGILVPIVRAAGETAVGRYAAARAIAGGKWIIEKIKNKKGTSVAVIGTIVLTACIVLPPYILAIGAGVIVGGGTSLLYRGRASNVAEGSALAALERGDDPETVGKKLGERRSDIKVSSVVLGIFLGLGTRLGLREVFIEFLGVSTAEAATTTDQPVQPRPKAAGDFNEITPQEASGIRSMFAGIDARIADVERMVHQFASQKIAFLEHIESQYADAPPNILKQKLLEAEFNYNQKLFFLNDRVDELRAFRKTVGQYLRFLAESPEQREAGLFPQQVEIYRSELSKFDASLKEQIADFEKYIRTGRIVITGVELQSDGASGQFQTLEHGAGSGVSVPLVETAPSLDALIDRLEAIPSSVADEQFKVVRYVQELHDFEHSFIAARPEDPSSGAFSKWKGVFENDYRHLLNLEEKLNNFQTEFGELSARAEDAALKLKEGDITPAVAQKELVDIQRDFDALSRKRAGLIADIEKAKKDISLKIKLPTSPGEGGAEGGPRPEPEGNERQLSYDQNDEQWSRKAFMLLEQERLELENFRRDAATLADQMRRMAPEDKGPLWQELFGDLSLIQSQIIDLNLSYIELQKHVLAGDFNGAGGKLDALRESIDELQRQFQAKKMEITNTFGRKLPFPLTGRTYLTNLSIGAENANFEGGGAVQEFAAMTIDEIKNIPDFHKYMRALGDSARVRLEGVLANVDISVDGGAGSVVTGPAGEAMQKKIEAAVARIEEIVRFANDQVMLEQRYAEESEALRDFAKKMAADIKAEETRALSNSTEV